MNEIDSQQIANNLSHDCNKLNRQEIAKILTGKLCLQSLRAKVTTTNELHINCQLAMSLPDLL